MPRLYDGGVKVALFLDRVVPSDEQVDALFDIEGVEEVSSTHAQDYKVIFYFDDAKELMPATYEWAVAAIKAALAEDESGQQGESYSD